MLRACDAGIATAAAAAVGGEATGRELFELCIQYRCKTGKATFT